MGRPVYKDSTGKRIPSVTTITGALTNPGGLCHWANKLGKEGKDYQEELNKAANTGTFAHKAIECHIKGESYAIKDDEAKQALESWQDWNKSIDIQYVALEVALYCDCPLHPPYGGTVDCIAEMGTGLCVVDWKTSKSIYVDYVFQVVAYAHLWEKGRLVYDKMPVANLGETISGYHILKCDKETYSFTDKYIKARDELYFSWFKMVRQLH